MEIPKLNVVCNRNTVSSSISDKNRIAESQKSNSENVIDFKETKQTKSDKFTENDLILNRLNLLKSDLKGMAKSIQNSNKGMEIVEQHVDDMQNQLETIVKNYPPFPLESQERISNLKNYSSIRKLIDKLTIPSVEEFIPEAITKKNGLQIPEIGLTDTDSKLAASLKELENVKMELKENRNDLKKEANDLDFSDIYRKINDKLIIPLNIHEINPEDLSIELRDDLSGQTDVRLSMDNSMLKDLL